MNHVRFLTGLVFLLAVASESEAQRATSSTGTSSANPGTVVSSAKQVLTGDGSRPGDENLTCDQIGEALQASFAGNDMTSMLSAAGKANAETGKTQKELAARQATEGAALQAAAMAEARAASAMAMNPATGAASAVAARQRMEALNQMQMAKATQGGRAGGAALQEYKQSTANLVTGNTDELTRMRALQELAQKKGCFPPAAMSADGYFEDDGEEESDEAFLEAMKKKPN